MFNSVPRSRRVALIYPRVALDSVPGLCQAVDLLAEAGYWVDVFTLDGRDVPAPRFGNPLVRVQVLGASAVAESPSLAGRAWQRMLRLAGISPKPVAIVDYGASTVWESAERDTFTCVIGVDPDGLHLAARLAERAPD